MRSLNNSPAGGSGWQRPHDDQSGQTPAATTVAALVLQKMGVGSIADALPPPPNPFAEMLCGLTCYTDSPLVIQDLGNGGFMFTANPDPTTRRFVLAHEVIYVARTLGLLVPDPALALLRAVLTNHLCGPLDALSLLQAVDELAFPQHAEVHKTVLMRTDGEVTGAATKILDSMGLAADAAMLCRVEALGPSLLHLFSGGKPLAHVRSSTDGPFFEVSATAQGEPGVTVAAVIRVALTIGALMPVAALRLLNEVLSKNLCKAAPDRAELMEAMTWMSLYGMGARLDQGSGEIPHQSMALHGGQGMYANQWPPVTTTTTTTTTTTITTDPMDATSEASTGGVPMPIADSAVHQAAVGAREAMMPMTGPTGVTSTTTTITTNPVPMWAEVVRGNQEHEPAAAVRGTESRASERRAEDVHQSRPAKSSERTQQSQSAGSYPAQSHRPAQHKIDASASAANGDEDGWLKPKRPAARQTVVGNQANPLADLAIPAKPQPHAQPRPQPEAQTTKNPEAKKPKVPTVAHPRPKPRAADRSSAMSAKSDEPDFFEFDASSQGTQSTNTLMTSETAVTSTTTVSNSVDLQAPFVDEFRGPDFGAAASRVASSREYPKLFGSQGAAMPLFAMVQVPGGTVCRTFAAVLDSAPQFQATMRSIDALAKVGPDGALVAAAATAALLAHETLPPRERAALARTLLGLVAQTNCVLPKSMQIAVWKALRGTTKLGPEVLRQLAPHVEASTIGPTATLSPRAVVEQIRQRATPRDAFLFQTGDPSQPTAFALTAGPDGEMLTVRAESLERIGDLDDLLNRLARTAGPAAAGLVAAALLTQPKVPRDRMSELALTCNSWLASGHVRLPKSMQRAIQLPRDVPTSTVQFLQAQLAPDLTDVTEVATQVGLAAYLPGIAPLLQRLFLRPAPFIVVSQDGQHRIQGRADMFKTEEQVDQAIHWISILADAGASSQAAALSAAAVAAAFAANQRPPMKLIESLLLTCTNCLKNQSSQLPLYLKDALAQLMQNAPGLPDGVRATILELTGQMTSAETVTTATTATTVTSVTDASPSESQLPAVPEGWGLDFSAASESTTSSPEYIKLFGPAEGTAKPLFSAVKVPGGGTICRASPAALDSASEFHVQMSIAALEWVKPDGALIAAAVTAELLAHEALPPRMRSEMAPKLMNLLRPLGIALPPSMQIAVWKALRTVMHLQPEVLPLLAPGVNASAVGPTAALSLPDVVEQIRQRAPQLYALLFQANGASRPAISLTTARDGADRLTVHGDSLDRIDDLRGLIDNLAKTAGPAAAAALAAAMLTHPKFTAIAKNELGFTCCAWLASAHVHLPEPLQLAVCGALEGAQNGITVTTMGFLQAELGPDLKRKVAPDVMKLVENLKLNLDPARLAAILPLLSPLFLTASAFTLDPKNGQVVGKVKMLKTETQLRGVHGNVAALVSWGAADLAAALSAAAVVAAFSANPTPHRETILKLLHTCRSCLLSQRSQLPEYLKEALKRLEARALPPDIAKALQELLN